MTPEEALNNLPCIFQAVGRTMQQIRRCKQDSEKFRQLWDYSAKLEGEGVELMAIVRQAIRNDKEALRLIDELASRHTEETSCHAGIWRVIVWSLQTDIWMPTSLAVRAHSNDEARTKTYAWYDTLSEQDKMYFNYADGVSILDCIPMKVIE